MERNILRDLFIRELKDLHSAEIQIINALPRMIKIAKHQKLAACLTEHLGETREQAARLERLLADLDQTTGGQKCMGMACLLEEGEAMIAGDEEARDAGLIAAAQHVEHYEIAGYECARTHAELLLDPRGAAVLQRSLDEEKAADKKLAILAKTVINVVEAD